MQSFIAFAKWGLTLAIISLSIEGFGISSDKAPVLAVIVIVLYKIGQVLVDNCNILTICDDLSMTSDAWLKVVAFAILFLGIVNIAIYICFVW